MLPKGFVEAALRYLAFTKPQRTPQQHRLGARRSSTVRQQVTGLESRLKARHGVLGGVMNYRPLSWCCLCCCSDVVIVTACSAEPLCWPKRCCCCPRYVVVALMAAVPTMALQWQSSQRHLLSLTLITVLYGSVGSVPDPRRDAGYHLYGSAAWSSGHDEKNDEQHNARTVRKPKTPVLGTRLVWAQDGEDRSWPPDWLSRDGE